jgi:hypothetical protein
VRLLKSSRLCKRYLAFPVHLSLHESDRRVYDTIISTSPSITLKVSPTCLSSTILISGLRSGGNLALMPELQAYIETAEEKLRGWIRDDIGECVGVTVKDVGKLHNV